MTRKYSIYETKAKLSQLLRLVKGGSDIVVTERGEPIAKIVPLQRGPQCLAERLSELRNRGLLIEKQTRPVDWNGIAGKPVSKPGALDRFLKARD